MYLAKRYFTQDLKQKLGKQNRLKTHDSITGVQKTWNIGIFTISTKGLQDAL